MMRLTNTRAAVQAAVALAIALIGAPVVRTVTSELTGTVGRAWPFSLARCVSLATSGCGDMFVQPARGPSAPHIRTGSR